jgi:hypothetical protein
MLTYHFRADGQYEPISLSFDDRIVDLEGRMNVLGEQFFSLLW